MTVETFIPTTVEDIEVIVNDEIVDIWQLWVYHHDNYIGSILPKDKGVMISYEREATAQTDAAQTYAAQTDAAQTDVANMAPAVSTKITAVNILLYKNNGEEGNTLLTKVPITIRSDELRDYTFYYL